MMHSCARDEPLQKGHYHMQDCPESISSENLVCHFNCTLRPSLCLPNTHIATDAVIMSPLVSFLTEADPLLQTHYRSSQFNVS